MEDEKIETPKETIKIKKSTVWQILTAVFAVLFVISLFTGGFGITGTSTTTNTSTGGTVSAILINDARCAECDVTGLVAQLKSLVPNLELKELDYSDKEGKALYDELGLKVLPALLFDKAIENEPAYAQMQRFITPKGDYLDLNLGARFDPTSEICDNKIDDTGNDLIDCDDPDCKGSLLCREEIPEKLDLFVMSHCPYGTQALNSMEQILKTFPDIDFNVWYIASENEDGTFNSLHGQPEVDENIRELCAMEHYPKKNRYMDYIWCRNKDIQSTDWESCAEEAKMDTKVIKECSEGEEGTQLLSENIKLANKLGISASPTWLANNIQKFSGIDAPTVQKNYCSANPDLEGCKDTLNASAESVPEGSCN